MEGTERLPPLVRQELYQIAQEALNNALKHARAQAVRVFLDFQENGTRLEVSDDGSGFEPDEANRGGGLGLRGMQERARGIGGTLRVESSPGRGTKVSILVPLDPETGRRKGEKPSPSFAVEESSKRPDVFAARAGLKSMS